MGHTLIPAFQLHMNQVINKRLATIGKYDGKHPSITCGTNAGKVFIHNPHERDFESQIKFLNINREVNSLCAGRLDPKNNKDILLIGTQTNLLGYDVENNADLFYREVSDGLNTMTMGNLGGLDMPLVIIGGNCSLQGYDYQGNEQYWTTTGGNVTSLVLIDVDNDGKSELLVGSDDYIIYIYQEDEILSEVTENDQITSLCKIRDTKYGYALQNGCIGIYNQQNRMWKVKSKHMPTCLEGYDLDGDGVPELIVGYENGRVEVRSEEKGNLIFKDALSGSVSSLMKADYRLDGKEEVICCAYSGEVRGYLPVDTEVQATFDHKLLEEEILKLNEKREELLCELTNYEENIRKIKTGETDAALISADTKVNCHLEPNPKLKCVDVVFETNEEQVIKAAIITAEQLFETESKIVYAQTPSNKIQVSLKPKKDIPIDLNIQVLVGHDMGTNYHVFELNYQMPRFALYIPVQEFPFQPKSTVTFQVLERPNRIIMWFNTAFNIKYNTTAQQKAIDFKFLSVRDQSPLQIQFADNQMTIRVDNMDVAGQLVQDLCGFLGVKQLETVCNFPQEFSYFESVLNQVEEYNATRLRLTADMADSSQAVKAFVIKAEDARVLGSMKQMREMYTELYRLNKDLIGEYTKRSNNHNHLLQALKEVNQMIEKASRLRVGDAKARVISECRNAIKTNNIHSLFKIIQTGKLLSDQ